MFFPVRYELALEKPLRVAHSSWTGHIPFAFTLVQIHKPEILVELGTYKGVSYCAFCQAVLKLGLPTRCTGVDTWKGDDQTGFYGEEVYRELSQYHDPLYGDFSRLWKMSFDEALPHFEDGTVDLLHIDGCHRYEAVRHDFESWLPKLSPHGLVLLHDTMVQRPDFGVGRLLDEIRTSYPVFEFAHSQGLGIVGVGARIEERESWELFQSTKAEADLIRRLFSSLGSAADCDGELSQLGLELGRLNGEREQMSQELARLNHELDQSRRELSAVREELSQRHMQLEDIMHSKPWKIACFLRKCSDLGARFLHSREHSPVE